MTWVVTGGRLVETWTSQDPAAPLIVFAPNVFDLDPIFDTGPAGIWSAQTEQSETWSARTGSSGVWAEKSRSAEVWTAV